MHIDRKSAKQPSRVSWLRLFWTSVVYQTKEFFNNSTLHGVRYIAEEGRPIFERLMWFIFTASGAIAAFIIIVNLWEKFQTNPTITGLDTDFHNQQVIFPTIDVCPMVPYDENRTKQLAYATLGWVFFLKGGEKGIGILWGIYVCKNGLSIHWEPIFLFKKI